MTSLTEQSTYTSNSSNHQDLIEVISPIDGSHISNVAISSKADLSIMVDQAKIAFDTWSKRTLKERAKVFFKYRTLLEKNIEELANLIQLENGKTRIDAKAEIEKSIELCEFAVSLPQIISNENQEVSYGVTCKSEAKPLGVVASIVPFNFPNMVPHWTIPNALVLGNTMIMKPSEIVPLSMIKISNLLKEAGLPEGVFTIANGCKEIVESICDHPDIKAISFVGSTKIAKAVYKRATFNLKRCIALGGAKNYLVVLPDAQINMTSSDIVASVSGCAGQRCMAASVLIGVGEVQHIIDKVVEQAKTIISGKNMGAVISAAAKERIERYITEAESLGAKIIVDGRNTSVAGKEQGFYTGVTIIDHVTPDIAIAREEVFGPVLSIIRVKNIEEAILIENTSNYGNAATVFTQNGKLAKKIAEEMSAGMVGVNIGVPVPREPFSFGGWNDSKFGVGDITGKSSINFWTQQQKTTVKWSSEAKVDWMS